MSELTTRHAGAPPLDPLPLSPPGAWEPLFRLAKLAGRPLDRFLRIEAASGILLVAAAVVAMVWANSPWASSYERLWHTPVGMRLGPVVLERDLLWLVNDVLMVIFFFFVGMEIRREIHHGELSEWRRAALPAAAAIGGMLVPAALCSIVTVGSDASDGWGVPMATDIAFAVGVVTILGRRIPAALRVLLLALAVIDDLGGIVVIALFYSPHIAGWGLALAAVGLGGIFALQALGVRRRNAYLLPGFGIWAGILASGIHPAVAGVIIGLVTPVRAWLGPDGFLRSVRRDLDHLSAVDHSHMSAHELSETLHHVDLARREALSPAEGLIEELHPWVAFVIMPVFAFANAGVSLRGVTLEGPAARLSVAVAVGLVIGKPVGVLLASALALAGRVAILPLGLSYRHLTVLGLTTGIGFTMAIFIGSLAFDDAPGLLAATKLGVLAASATAAALALAAGRLLLPAIPTPGAALTADEAESSTEL